jgi:hypothetical protein
MEEGQKTEETKGNVDTNLQFLGEIASFKDSENPTQSDTKRTKGLRGKKKAMVEALRSTLGVVMGACKKVGINRDTHYAWLKEDERYARACEEIQDLLLDFGENALLVLMQEKNPQAIVHFAKTKLKKRGYGESLEVKQEIKDSRLEVEIVYTDVNKLKEVKNEVSDNNSVPLHGASVPAK